MYLGNEINLKVFSDLDWANNEDDRRSTTGYFFKIVGGSVSWASRRQKTVAMLSIEVEYMALLEVVCESKWIIELIKDLGFQIWSPIIIYCDNESVITIAETKGIKHRRQIKYIDVQHHYIKERMEAGEI